jgi:hypothetical protein
MRKPHKHEVAYIITSFLLHCAFIPVYILTFPLHMELLFAFAMYMEDYNWQVISLIVFSGYFFGLTFINLIALSLNAIYHKLKKQKRNYKSAFLVGELITFIVIAILYALFIYWLRSPYPLSFL